MDKARSPLRKISLSGRATHRMYRWVALSFITACAAVSSTGAQDNGNIPVIRLESRQVLVPTQVFGIGSCVYVQDAHDAPQHVARDVHVSGYLVASHLAARDFHLFEDKKEQTIESVTLINNYQTILADNLGYQRAIAFTPKGEWTLLHDMSFKVSPHYPLYYIAYRPPSSPEGSCHKIKIKVDPKDESGHGLTEIAGTPFSCTTMANRRNLLLYYRTQYCNLPHSATDPLYGTPVSERLESAANSDKTEANGFFLSAIDFYDESNISRIRVALDFPHLSDQTGIPEFQITLLGEISRTKGDLAARFSDSKKAGCPIKAESNRALRQSCGRDFFDNHYETEVELPPGDYDLQVAIDFGGALRRAEVPVHVRAPKTSLAVSGIALCRQYYAANQLTYWQQRKEDGIATMPFEMAPLVSKGIGFTPTAETRFKKSDPLSAYFEVYEPLLTGGGNVHVQFEMRVVDAKTSEVKSDSGFKPADGYVNQGKMIIPISQKVAIEELTPGEYQVQVRAKDSAGNSTDWRATSFTRE